MSAAPLGDGLQLERTMLAWRRTALSVGVAALASVRVLFDSLAYGAVAVGGAGFVLACVLYALSVRRSRSVRRGLNAAAPREARLPGGLPLALCAGVVLAVGVVALLYVLAA